MSSCPFCYGTLLPTFSHGLQREKCGRCAALWFEGAALAKVVGGSATDALIERARGKHGECKGCDAKLAYVPQCAQCGQASPTCPQCGTAPLSVAEVFGVEVDICPGCRGVALDAGELELLIQAGEASRNEEFDLRPAIERQKLSRPKCAGCQRSLRPRHAFAFENQLYCGSCAPRGCVPYEMHLTRATPSLVSEDSPTDLDFDQPHRGDFLSRFIERMFRSLNERS